ncbi:hypothetical protein [Micromonospora sonchi]|uniref:hypothetical protein n=1 Tax=Micromonospora sonchi TaxID=1763543 RepID=UPI001665F025|nr:hypothetical protein [Micromonospora sonchi]
MRRLFVAVGVNLLLGVLAVVPLFLIWYALSNGPLAALGWTRPEPTENDGMLIWWLLAAVTFGGFASIWGMVNVWARRRVAVPGSRYWPACVAASLVPFCLILLR